MGQLAGLNQLMNDFADRLDRLNEMFPDLATSVTRGGVASWRQTQAQDEVDTRGPELPREQDGSAAAEPVDLRPICLGLLRENGLEDILEIVASEYGIDLNIAELVDLLGTEVYVSVLKRDVQQLSKNSISYDQIANLWNELRRPALTAPTWSARSISVLAG